MAQSTRVCCLLALSNRCGRVLLKLDCKLEIEGEAKPAVIAEVLCMLIAKR